MKETPEARRERLQTHAEFMRLKRAAQHVCPPNKIDTQMQKLQDLLERVAPDNIAPIPISMAREEGRWKVDIHVRRKRITEYELTGESDELAGAIANARSMLSRVAGNEARGVHDASLYGYEV